MSPFLEPWESALLDPSSDVAVRALAQAVHETIAHWTTVYARVNQQPEGALRDQRLAQLDAIHARLLYYAGLMDLLGTLYVPPGRPLYSLAIYEPAAALPSWSALQGTVADGFAEQRLSVAQWLDEGVARPLLEGDYNAIWSMGVVEVERTEDEQDGEPIVNYAAPPPGIMAVGEWDQITDAQSSTTTLAVSMDQADSSPQPWNAYKSTTIASSGQSVPTWVWVAAIGITGLFIGAAIAKRSGD